MAIAYSRVHIHTRSKGHSAVAAAAYRSGMRLTDERTGEVHDFSARARGDNAEVLHTEIVTPENAPIWARVQGENDERRARSAIWNALEAKNTRSNSRVCRDVVFALPHELGLEQWKSMTSELANFIAREQGVAVDIAIHRPDPAGDERNHHAHLLLSTHVLEATGFTDKARALDVKDPKEIDKRTGKPFGRTGGDVIKGWREQWAHIVNRELTRAGFGQDHHIDMRSYEDQGADREGQTHKGKDATALERKGVQTRVANDNRSRAQRNLHRIRMENFIRQRREDLRAAFARRQIEEQNLSATHKGEAEFLYDRKEENIAIRRANIKKNFRPQWATLFKRQKQEWRELNEAQKSAPARLYYFFKNRDPAQRAGMKDAARAIFGFDNPHGALSRKHRAERRALADQQVKQTRQAIFEENRSYQRSLDRLSEQHGAERDALKASHSRESQDRARDIAQGRDFERYNQEAERQRIAQEFNRRIAEQMRIAKEREARVQRDREKGRDEGEERERD